MVKKRLYVSDQTQSDIRSVIKIFGKCLNKKIYYSERHIALNPPPPKYFPSLRTHLSLRSCHILKQFWKSFFVSVFSCAVVASSMSWIDSKRLPFTAILTLGKYRRKEIDINVDISSRYRESKINYRYESKHFPTNTVQRYQRERHFINKANCAHLVRVWGINKREESQELEFLKYAYSS